MEKKIYGRNDVAKLAGVAPSTVSHVINHTKFVSDGVRERVLKAVRELEYEPNLLAKSLRARSTYQIIVLISDLYNSYYADICKGVMEEAAKNGYSVLVGITQADDRDYYKEYNLRQVDGIINFSSSFCCQETFEKLRARNTAMVNCRPFDEDYSIGVNYVNAVAELVRRLAARGRRKVAMMTGGDRESLRGDTRYIALKYHLEQAGIPFREELIEAVGETGAHGAEVLREGSRSMEQLLARDPDIDAVFCINDMMAFGARSYLEQAGRRIPADLSLCGCDDIFFSDFLEKRISTMSFDKEEFGRTCARCIFAQIRGEADQRQKSTVLAEYIERGSV